MTGATVITKVELLAKELSARGASAPSFDYNGTSITNPRTGECGRFPVDPCDEYGEHNVLQWIRKAEEVTKIKIMTIRELFDWEDRAATFGEVHRRWVGDEEVHNLDALPDLLRDYGIKDPDDDTLVVCSWEDSTVTCLPNDEMHVALAQPLEHDMKRFGATEAVALASILGGRAEQTGGGVWVVFIHRSDGKRVGITDESVVLYPDCEWDSESEEVISLI